MKAKYICALSTAAFLLLPISSIKSMAGYQMPSDIEGNLGQEEENSEEKTLYGIGSVSKIFTASAVMKLVDEGRIDLDKPLVQYIEEFKMADERYKEITPRMLLNHSSGLMGSNYSNISLMGDNDTMAHDTFLEGLREQRLKADPGDYSVYCNDGFTLAEILVERVSGMSFTEYIEENFSKPLGMTDTKTPLSVFDKSRIAENYYKNRMELPPENINSLGTGGLYSTTENLCRFAGIFMDGNNKSILSKSSVKAMGTMETKDLSGISQGYHTVSYGLGWDSVETEPFGKYGIKALSKGGTTQFFNTNLTVLPKYNLAASVIASGGSGDEQLIVQEILMEVLREEGIIEAVEKEDFFKTDAPQFIPETLKEEFEGVYASDSFIDVKFSGASLFISTLGTENDKTQEYVYGGNGEFISTNGDYITTGFMSAEAGTTGSTKLTFKSSEDGDSYILIYTLENKSGLGQSTFSQPFAQKLKGNSLSEEEKMAWEARAEKTYYLINGKYTSADYFSKPIARIGIHDMAQGYISQGIYKGPGCFFKSARITDENHADAFLNMPISGSRDLNDFNFQQDPDGEIFKVNGNQYISEEYLKDFSDIEAAVKMGKDRAAIWYRVDPDSNGKEINISVPENGSVFVYDSKMNCTASSLTRNRDNSYTLPVDGRIVLIGAAGAEFTINE